MEDDDPNLKLTKSEADIPVSLTRSQSLDFNMFIGPNEFNKLYAYDNGLEEIIPFGRSIFGTINRWLIRPSFNFLSNYIGSKGIVIIILIFAIKMLLYPLMYKMLKSQAKMSALKPELTQLKEKYKDDQQKQQMEQQHAMLPNCYGTCFSRTQRPALALRILLRAMEESLMT